MDNVMMSSLAGLGDSCVVGGIDPASGDTIASCGVTFGTGDSAFAGMSADEQAAFLAHGNVPTTGVTTTSWLVMGAVFLGLVLIGGGSGKRR